MDEQSPVAQIDAQTMSKYITYGDKSNQFSNPLYDQEYQAAINDKQAFWKKQADDLVWTKKPT